MYYIRINAQENKRSQYTCTLYAFIVLYTEQFSLHAGCLRDLLEVVYMPELNARHLMQSCTCNCFQMG